MNELTISNRHQDFLEHVLAGNPLDVAGKKAGFSSPQRDAYPVLNHPEVRKRFTKIVQGKAVTEGLVVCYNYFVELVRDTNRPDKIRLDAAKFLYAHHMPGVKAEEAANTQDKSVSEMTREELHNAIQSIESELGARAEPTQPIDSMI